MTSGQASTDYVAVLLVVAVVLVGSFAWADGRALADGVEHAFARALCVARGGDCDVDALPCVTASDDTQDEATVTVAFIKLGGRSGLLRQTRSDGTVLITKGRLLSGGPAAGIGTKTDVQIPGLKVQVGLDGEASLSGLFERSRTWIAPSAAAADRLVARLKDGGELPPPAMTTDRSGLESSIEVTLARGRLGAALGLTGRAVQEERRDATTGRRTLVVEHGAEGFVSLTAAELGARASGSILERYGVVLDRGGRPVDLVVTRQGQLGVAADLPKRLQAVAGLLSTPTKAGRLWWEETHLDLTDPANLAVARAFLAQVSDPSALGVPGRVAVTRALAQRLDAVGVEHVRTMSVEESRFALGETGGAGLARLGGEISRKTIRQRILDAATRGVDGVWRRRADCVAHA